MDAHKSVEALWKDVHRRFYALASRPEGPAEPFICRAVDWMKGASICSKMMGWSSLTGGSSLLDCGETSTSGGCLASRWSLTVLPSGWTLLGDKEPEPPCSVINLMAAFTFPWETSFWKALAFLTSSRFSWWRWLSLLWMKRHSWRRDSTSPFFHLSSLSSRHWMWTLVPDLGCDLWSSSAGKTIAAFIGHSPRHKRHYMHLWSMTTLRQSSCQLTSRYLKQIALPVDGFLIYSINARAELATMYVSPIWSLEGSTPWLAVGQ